MPNIIKQGQIVEDNWDVWRDSEAMPDRDHVIVPLSLWQSHRDAHLSNLHESHASSKSLNKNIKSIEILGNSGNLREARK